MSHILWMSAQKIVLVKGQVLDQKTEKSIKDVSVLIQNTSYGTTTDKNGYFEIQIPPQNYISILFSHLSYDKRLKEYHLKEQDDTLWVTVLLSEKQNILDSVAVYSRLKPDTLVGSPKFSIYDFDFYEDQFILLTAEKSLEKAELKYANYDGKIIHSSKIPREAGIAKELYHDYMGYTNVVCENMIYRVVIFNESILLLPIHIKDYQAYIKPVVDTLNGKIIFSDYWRDYPLFNYYTYNSQDSSKKQLITITNEDLMHAYNFEYYAMKPAAKLEARRMAMDLKTDKRIIAALMSGFTQSMFYEPLYAPLFIIKDTMCIFDHYKDMLFHFDRQGSKIDSVAIHYNHPKNWREWKRMMVKDDFGNQIYAIYDKNGHKYLKRINHRTGMEMGKYNLQFYSADRIKIRDGYVYYIYRPFESTQEKFLYREFIQTKAD